MNAGQYQAELFMSRLVSK